MQQALQEKLSLQKRNASQRWRAKSRRPFCDQQTHRNKDEILNTFHEIVGGVYDTHTLEGEKAKLESEMDVCAKMIEDLIRQNAAILQDQSEYQAKYEDLERFYDEKQAALAKAEGKLKKMQTTKADIEFSWNSCKNKIRFCKHSMHKASAPRGSHHGIWKRRYPRDI